MPVVPPENTNYMILGYVVVVSILAVLVVYLVLKARSLRAELDRLEGLEAEDQASRQARATPTSALQQDSTPQEAQRFS
jgi:hypothetical protein